MTFLRWKGPLSFHDSSPHSCTTERSGLLRVHPCVLPAGFSLARVQSCSEFLCLAFSPQICSPALQSGRLCGCPLPVRMSWLTPSTEITALGIPFPCTSLTMPLMPRWTCGESTEADKRCLALSRTQQSLFGPHLLQSSFITHAIPKLH